MYLSYKYYLPSSDAPEATIFFLRGREEESQNDAKNSGRKVASFKSKPDFVSAGPGPLIIIKLQGSSQTNGIVSLQLIQLDTAAEQGGVRSVGQNMIISSEPDGPQHIC